MILDWMGRGGSGKQLQMHTLDGRLKKKIMVVRSAHDLNNIYLHLGQTCLFVEVSSGRVKNCANASSLSAPALPDVVFPSAMLQEKWLQQREGRKKSLLITSENGHLFEERRGFIIMRARAVQKLKIADLWCNVLFHVVQWLQIKAFASQDHCIPHSSTIMIYESIDQSHEPLGVG